MSKAYTRHASRATARAAKRTACDRRGSTVQALFQTARRPQSIPRCFRQVAPHRARDPRSSRPAAIRFWPMVLRRRVGWELGARDSTNAKNAPLESSESMHVYLRRRHPRRVVGVLGIIALHIDSLYNRDRATLLLSSGKENLTYSRA